MSRIGSKPVAMPASVKVSVADSTIQVEGPKGKLAFSYRSEIDVKVDEAGQQVLVTRPRRRAAEPRPARPDPQPDRQHGRGRHQRLQKKLKIEGVGYQAQLKTANTVVLPVGYANQIVLEAAGGRDASPSPTRPTSPSAAPTSRRSASSPPRSARSARPSRTRARASATRARSSAARQARRSGRSSSARIDHAVRQQKGLGVRSASAAPNPRRGLERDRPVSNQRKQVQTSPAASATPRPQAPLRDGRAAPAGRLPQLQAHLRPGDQRRHRRDAGLGQHAGRRRPQGAAPTAATRPPPRSSGELVAERGQAGRY